MNWACWRKGHRFRPAGSGLNPYWICTGCGKVKRP